MSQKKLWPGLGFIARIVLLSLAMFVNFILLQKISPQIKNAYAVNENFFPYGLYETGGVTNTPEFFTSMIDSMEVRGLDSVMFTNSVNNSLQLQMLDVADSRGIKVIWGGPMGAIKNQWLDANVPPENAETILGPMVDAVKSHPSIKGYNLRDDTELQYAEKLKVVTQIFQAHDASRSASPTYIIGNEKASETIGSNSFFTYYYPAKATKNVCDWNYISSTQNDYVVALRNLSRYKPDSTPMWNVLQAHGQYAVMTPGAPVDKLRVPTLEELTLQNWMALGEGSKGMFWFIYSTLPDQFWTGLEDNPTFYNKIGSLGNRTRALSATFLPLVKTNDYFSLSGSGNRYISTLVNPSTGKYYLVVANGDCSSNQNLTVSSSVFQGNLKDLETNQVIPMTTAFSVPAGDARIFEVKNLSGTIPVATPAPNIFTNDSFETVSNGNATGWNGPKTGSMIDTTTSHTGSNSLKITGSAVGYTSQSPAALKAGTLYTIKYWVKSAGPLTGKGVGLRVFSGVSGTSPTSINFTTGDNSNWKQVVDTFYTPITYTSTGRLDIYWELNSGETAWIDDVSICEGNNCLPKVVNITAPPADLTTELKGYWKADQLSWNNDCSTLSVKDSSGIGNHGKACPVGSAPQITPGKFGNAGSFDGVDDHVLANVSKTNRKFVTLAGWLNFDDPHNVNNVDKYHTFFGWQYELQVKFRSYTSEPGIGYLLNVTGTTAGGSTNNINLTYLLPTKLSSWHHVATTYDGTKVRLYLDGVEVASQTLADVNGIKNNNRSFAIGRESDSSSTHYWDGKVDDVRYYNRALNEDEMWALYNLTPSTGPVANWDFEGGSSSSILDTSGNGIVGSWSGVSTNRYGIGKSGSSSALFNGLDDVITSSVSKTNRIFASVMGWVNFDDSDNINNVDKYHTFFGWQYELQIKFRSYTSEPGAGYFLNVKGTTASGSTNNMNLTYLLPTKLVGWHHVATTYDGVKVRLFLDGTEVASQNLADAGGIKNNNRDFAIGRESDSSSTHYWDGLLDDVRYYNYARSQTQITEDMVITAP